MDANKKMLMLTKSELESIVESAVKSAVNALKAERLLGGTLTVYKKTEQLLRHLNTFKSIVAEREEDIEYIREYGLPRSAKDIVVWTPKANGNHGTDIVDDVVEETVERMTESVEKTSAYIRQVETAVDLVRDDPWFYVLDDYYFKGMRQEDIAANANVVQTTVARNKARLVREIQYRLFPRESMEELIL